MQCRYQEISIRLIAFCKNIESYVTYYKRKIKSYNHTAHNILRNEINLMLPQIPGKQKCGIITTRVSSFIGLAYEGISRFIHNRRHKALYKVVKPWNSKTTIQHNKLIQLENSMLMYGIYNTETSEHLINMVHCIHNTTSSHEKLFTGQHNSIMLGSLYVTAQGIQHYSINSLLYLRTIQDRYVSLYKELITQLHIYATPIRVLAKGYPPISLINSFKIERNFK